MQVHWKIKFGEGGGQKNSIYMRDWLKTGAWAVCRFRRGACWKRGGGDFWGGLIPQCILCMTQKAPPIFDHDHPKIIKKDFSFPDFP